MLLLLPVVAQTGCVHREPVAVTVAGANWSDPIGRAQVSARPPVVIYPILTASGRTDKQGRVVLNIPWNEALEITVDIEGDTRSVLLGPICDAQPPLVIAIPSSGEPVLL